MLLSYVITVISYLFYQATIGGLFFLMARTQANHLFLPTMLLIIEPMLMLLFGLRFSKKIDLLRSNKSPGFSYLRLPTRTMVFLILFIFSIHYSDSLLLTLLCYCGIMASFILERIHRQRFPRDFSRATNISATQANAIANLANRGAPVLSPLVLTVSSGLPGIRYVLLSLVICFFCSFTYMRLSKLITKEIQYKENSQQLNFQYYNSEKLGSWHLWHLLLMNAVLGGLFLVLTHNLITMPSIPTYLHGPTVYFIGFWLSILMFCLRAKSIPRSPMSGLGYTAVLGLMLVLSSQSDVYVSALMLCLGGFFFGIAINRLGTFVQTHLDPARYSYYETRAQTVGRVALLISLSLSGWALSQGYSSDTLLCLMGGGTITCAISLALLFKTLRLTNQPAVINPHASYT